MSSFSFKHFSVEQSNSALKVGTDAMVLGAFIDAENANNSLDIGSGTGVLSLMIAQKNPTIHVTAIEIDELSCLDCLRNFLNSPWNNRLNLLNSNFLTQNFSGTFDLIFSNPPFYENSLINSDTRKAKAKHESHLSFYLLFEKVSKILSEIGTFWIIMPYENANKWIENASEYSLYCIQKINIFAKPNSMKRTILVFSKIKSEMLLSDFIIRNNNNSYSDEYIQLTKDFHSKVL